MNHSSFIHDFRDDAEIDAIRSNLLKWFDVEKRTMPWRKTVDYDVMTKDHRSQRAYEVWISEIMLQQVC